MPVPTTNPVHQRSLLRDDVYRAIRDAIVTGALQPGEKLIDAQLQQWLGVSRTPIREALLRLERTGLVTAIPGRSTMVTPYDRDAVAHSRAVAAELHALAAFLAVPNLRPKNLKQLQDSNEALRHGVGTQNADQCVQADDTFHGVFTTGSQNPVLAEHLEQVMPVLRRAEYLHFDSGRAHASLAQHQAIIDAAAASDAGLCRDLVRSNWMALET
ncbi:GntR family transcriptional regulator [Nesterenkonia haasae]|uniref:GntR family transcriptional regulator n=1 Tax=Nesterenkonia haasae TaxID=2587813 RepID=UPI0013918E62|nr:GntR family transcriptional regulator [Nesterenkonia haasae]NDK32983.1 GntR family transcriptional regulator [Nesterenkonia haasae]